MNKEQAIAEVKRLRAAIKEQVEWNFGRVNDEAYAMLEKVWALEQEFSLPSSTP
jgi:hypothetical protein